jgi:hypothetical protein
MNVDRWEFPTRHLSQKITHPPSSKSNSRALESCSKRLSGSISINSQYRRIFISVLHPMSSRVFTIFSDGRSSRCAVSLFVRFKLPLPNAPRRSTNRCHLEDELLHHTVAQQRRLYIALIRAIATPTQSESIFPGKAPTSIMTCSRAWYPAPVPCGLLFKLDTSNLS